MYNQLHIFNKGKEQIITTLLLVTSGSRETNQNDHTARERTFLWVNYCVSVCVWLEKACCCAAAVHWLADVSSVQGRPALPQSAQAPPAAVRSCHGNQTVQCWVWRGGLSPLQQPMEQRHPIRCVCITSLLWRVPMVAVPVF